MANPNRSMARMVRVDAINPIPNADRIQAARVGGWTVVVGRDEFEVGELAVYFEVDSFLPEGDPRYEQFMERGTKPMMVDGKEVNGHVLRTIRLRGVYSQGLLMKPSAVLPESIPESAYEEMWERKTNLTALCGVREFDPIRGTDQGNMHILRRYDSEVAPRTDAERIQNVSEEVFDIFRKTEHFASVKVDGTSMTCLFDPRYEKIRLFSHNNELAYDEAFGKQVYDQAVSQGIIAFLEANHGITLQFEACGPKINGNRLGLKAMRLFVFSAWEMELRKYLDPYQLLWDFGDASLRESLTPKLKLNLSDFASTLDLIEYVDGLRGHVTDRLDEGIVLHAIRRGEATDEELMTLQNELGSQLQIKVISRAYLLKAK